MMLGNLFAMYILKKKLDLSEPTIIIIAQTGTESSELSSHTYIHEIQIRYMGSILQVQRLVIQ